MPWLLLSKISSDHSPIIFWPRTKESSGKSFKYEAMWEENPESENVIRDAWNHENQGEDCWDRLRSSKTAPKPQLAGTTSRRFEKKLILFGNTKKLYGLKDLGLSGSTMGVKTPSFPMLPLFREETGTVWCAFKIAMEIGSKVIESCPLQFCSIFRIYTLLNRGNSFMNVFSTPED
ncbi:hypothetical protein SESBI_22419 [Sesbania bispinosa]|nr:hypothetical protein SESBI_22419 [Sesbania bispinosa]